MKRDTGRILINLTFLVLGVYYTFLTIHTVGNQEVRNDLFVFYKFVTDEFWLLFILELIAIVSLFADTILVFDKLSKGKRVLHLLFSVLFVGLFFGKLFLYWFGLGFRGLDL